LDVGEVGGVYRDVIDSFVNLTKRGHGLHK